ncbi:MAG: hypothetical protein JSW25_08395, partial [Thermoplasmata archaeon]
MALVMVMLLVGSAIAVYNADTLYLAGEQTLTSQLPSSLTPNATNSLMLLTTDGNGDPVGDQVYTVEVVQGNDTLVEHRGRTDGSGFAAPMFEVPYFEGEAELRVISGEHVLVNPVEPVATSHIFLTTDKPIYQPGQTVHSRVLVLRGDHVAEGSKAVFEVKTPEGDLVLRKDSKLNEFGVTSFDYVLSDQLPLGDYELKVIVDGQEAVRTVKVDEYVLPRFEITVGDMKPWYTPSETIDGFILAKYFFGQRVVGQASLAVNLYDGSNWTYIHGIPSTTLDDGGFEFEVETWVLDSAINEHIGYNVVDTVLVEFNFTVIDTGDHSEHESYIITYAASPIVTSVLTDANVDGERSTYYAVARFPNGAPVAGADVEFWFDDDKAGSKTATTDHRGIAALKFTYDEDDSYMHIVVTKDEYESQTDLEMESSTGLKVVPDRTTYQVGDVARLSIFYDGPAASDLVYYDVVADGFTIITGHLSMDGTRTKLDLPVTSDFGRLTSVRVYKVESNFNIARDVAIIGVQKEGDLDIDITPSAQSYLPQEDVSIDIRVTRDGDGVAAVLGVSIVDNAVFELGSRFTGFEEVLAGLLPQYSDPIYQFMGYLFVGDTPLPSVTVNQWDKIEAAPVETTGTEQGENAAALEDQAVVAYWTVLAALGIAALIFLAIRGPKTRQARALAVVAMLVLVSAGAIGMLMVQEPDDDFGNFAQPMGFGAERMGGGDMAMEDDGGPELPPIWQVDDEIDFNAPKTTGIGDSDGGRYLLPKTSITRQFFPETWAWIPVMPTDAEGRATLDLVAPDSITSWDVGVIASTKDARVGVGHQNVTVFQEFFVEPDLPAKAYLEDTFPLKVQVYNYGEPTDVTVTLDNAEWFQVVGDRQATVAMTTGEVSSVEFTITLTKVGIHEITVHGESDTFIDTVIRPLRVKPVGEKLEDLYQGRLSPGDVVDYNLTLVPELIENSENAWVKLQGGVEAAVLEGAESYIHYVSGCGEQSMSTLSIDVLAFRTVREGELDEARLLELEMIVNQGIIHELQYLKEANNGQGRGIVWFPSDQDVHIWLTSWGVITFKDAQLAGFTVDQDIIDDMQSWLLSQQKGDGSWEFPSWGLYEFNNPKLQQKKVATTAYVAHSLIYSGIPTSHEAIQDAVAYLKDNIRDADNWDDPYVLALTLKVLADAGEQRSQLAEDMADQLHELAQEDNGTVYWGTTTNMISNDFFGPEVGFMDMWSYNPGFNIEATGYATQALHLVGRYPGDVDGGLKYLLDHRSSLGGYFSTQDTVVAFQTIYEVSTKQAPVDIDVEVLVGDQVVWTLAMDETNRDITYLFDLRPLLEDPETPVRLRASGEGFIMFQVYLEQWVPHDSIPVFDLPLTLELDYPTWDPIVGQVYTVTATVRNNQDRSIQMALVELTAPVGMEFDHFLLEELAENDIVDNVEFEDDMVRLYINDVYKEAPISFSYNLIPVEEAQVTWAGNRVFDMYNALVEMEL